jgi:hypothetical protein
LQYDLDQKNHRILDCFCFQLIGAYLEMDLDWMGQYM